jgi:signal transduction histidine kinase
MTKACKYSPVGSDIIFELARVNSNIIIKVKDFGIGIPEKDKSLLFDAFHRAANVGSVAGTGLGLPITLSAVEQHYGTISFESQVGEGSTFIVELPAFQV